jgi:hypothetical protein
MRDFVSVRTFHGRSSANEFRFPFPFGKGLGVRLAGIEHDARVLLTMLMRSGQVVIVMAMREAQIDALANHLVNALVDRGLIKPKADVKELVACVVELMSANFETEAKIDEEADKMAEAEARRDTRLDVTRLRNMIRQRLAEKKNFTL